jgi:Ricin-type beta-trefoil lectin domain-like
MNLFRRVFLLSLIVFSLIAAISSAAYAAPIKEKAATSSVKPNVAKALPACTPKNKGQKYNLPVPFPGQHYLVQCQCFTMVLENKGSTTECRWVVIGVPKNTWEDLNSGLYMDVEGVSFNNGARIHQWTYTGALNQVWNLKDSSYGGGAINMYSANSNLCLGVSGGSITQGAPIVQWDCNNHPDQAWYWAWTETTTSSGWPTFNAVNWDSGMCLGITGGSTQVGAYAVQWGCNGSGDQEWY